MVSTRFESLGAFFPTKSLSTQELISRMSFQPPFDLVNITGIKQRRVCGESKDSFPLALEAARDCLKRSRYRAEDLDIIISTSITRTADGHKMYWEPSFALFLARELGAKSANHFDISNACAGMLSGVYLLDRMIKAGIVRNGMVVSGECITPIADTAVQEIEDASSSQFASLTVGDSGAAVILDKAENENDKIHYIKLMTCAEYSHLCIGKPSDRGGGPALYTNNKEMHKEERVQLWPRFQMEYLAQMGTDFASEKYDYIIHHQVGTRAIQNFSRFGQGIFNTEMPESLSCVADFANTATTSHFVVLYNHLQSLGQNQKKSSGETVRETSTGPETEPMTQPKSEKKAGKGAKFLLVPAASGVVTGCLSATISSLEI